MNKYKKLSIIGLSLLLFLFSACPIFAQNSTEFLTDYWINNNGYWIHPRKQIYNTNTFEPINYFPIYGKTADASSNSYGGCYFVKSNGKYRISGDKTGISACDLWYATLVSLNIINIYDGLTVSYNSSNKDTIINTLNGVGFKYTVNDTSISYYVPTSYIYYSFVGTNEYYNASLTYQYTYNDDGTYTSKEIENENKYIFQLAYKNSGYPNYIYGYKLTYKLDSENTGIIPIFTPYIFNNINSIFSSSSSYYGTYTLRANGDMINTNFLPPYNNGTRYPNSGAIYPLENRSVTNYNHSGKYGLCASFLLGIIPSSIESSNMNDLTEKLILYKYSITDPQYLENSFTNSSLGDSFKAFYNNGLDSFFDFTANNETHLPVSYANYIYNIHTYWNNRNNYYWWSILNYNPDDNTGTEQNPDDSTPDNPSGGGSGGGSGSGGDGNITIDTQNIENLLQQILEALQNQGTTEVDLTEIENLLNAIKNNLKDYTGDLTTINNSLTLINQFLSNNIDIPLSDLKTLLTDIKTLSEYQKEQLTGISAVLHDMKQLFIDIYNRLGEIKEKIGGTINNIEPGTNLWDVLKALIDNLGEFLSSGLELFEKLLVPQGTFQTDFNSTIAGIQDKLGVLYQPVDVFSNFLTNLYAPTETSTLADSGHVITIPEAKYDGVTIIEAQSIDLDETVEKSGLKPLYDVYLLIVDMIVLFGILNLAFKKFHDIISENGGDYK